MSYNVGRSRRPWCYHKRGISLDDNLGARIEDEFTPFSVNEGSGDKSMSTSDTIDKEEDMAEVSTLQTRFGQLLSCEDMADIHFIVGSGNHSRKLRIPAHKLVLAVASPVFKAMFFDEENEASVEGQEEENIELPDIEPIVFLEFLRYLYTDEIKLTRDNAIAILYSAKKYDIPGLEKTCTHFLKYSISEKNCLMIWLSAKLFGEEEFETLALKVIERYAYHVCLAPDFLRADYQSICQLLCNDLLRIDEVDLFRAVTRWGKNECLRNGLCPTRVNIREVLGEAINLIRFPLMTEEQISRTVANEGVLEDDTLKLLLSNSRTWPRITKPVQFSSIPRVYQRLQSNLLTVQRFQSYDNQLPNRYTNKSLCFTANKRIFVAGIGVYGPRKACTFYIQASFQIVKTGCANPTLIDHIEKNLMLKCDGSQPIINIKLDEPFEIEPNMQYEITAKITPTNRPTSAAKSKFNPHLFYSRSQEVNFYYGTGGQFAAKVKTNNNENVIFNFSWDNNFDDTISETSQIPPSSSAPPTPNPPPRPPPPKEYRRPSRIERLKRALSFSEKEKQTIQQKDEEKFNLLQGQIPVIMFYV
jgi:BTB/POZ domain-containing protein 1/2